MGTQARRRTSPNRPHKLHLLPQPVSIKNKRQPIRKALITFLITASLIWTSFVLYCNNVFRLGYHYLASDIDWDMRRNDVKEAFMISWDAYKHHAWGQDRYHPISGRGSQMSPNGLGWIIVDSLDTMMIMNLSHPLAESREWLQSSLSYNQDQDVNTFETTIRMLGGLLSAHYLTGRLPDVSSRNDSVYLDKAIDLGDRLLAAYESQSGIPYASVHIGKKIGIPSHSDGGASSMAEAATLQLEMKYLSYLTGNDTYWRKAEKVMKVLDDNQAQDGLLPIFVHPESGRFTTSEIRLGSRGDSYYEYLVKQYLQTSQQEPIYLEMWEQAIAGIQTHLITTTAQSNLKIVAELPGGIGHQLSPKMDHLVCFLPGTIALGATMGYTLSEARKLPDWNAAKEEQMELATDLMKTCWAMYDVTETGLAPEIAWFKVNDDNLQPNPGDRSSPSTRNSRLAWKKDFVIKPLDAHNLQRPETVESLFMMWRITEDPIYREWGWKIFKAYELHTKLDGDKGYTSINDVNTVPPPLLDNMESFWLAETLKYLYLLFSPSDYLPIQDIVFNTEAHIFPRFEMGPFVTGWQRKKTQA